MNKKWIRLFVLGLIASGVARADAIFTDTFENGVVADSDTETGFWANSDKGNGTYDGIVESSGVWTISAGRSGGTVASYYQQQSGVDSRFDFTSEALVFQASTTINGINGMNPDEAAMRFMVTPSVGNLGANPDAIYLQYNQDNTGQLFVKNNGSQTSMVAFDLGSDTITSFELTLSATGYELILHNTGASDYVNSGTYTVDPGDWASGGTVSLVAFDQGSVAGAQVDVTFDDFTVAPVPEPVTLGMFALSGAGLIVVRRVKSL